MASVNPKKNRISMLFFVVIGCKNETNFNFRKPFDQTIATFILNVTKKSVPKDEVDFSKTCAPAAKTQLLEKRIQRQRCDGVRRLKGVFTDRKKVMLEGH